MKISELINELEKMKKEYGDIGVIYGSGDDTIDFIKAKKYIISYNPYHQTRQMDTEDLNQNYFRGSI